MGHAVVVLIGDGTWFDAELFPFRWLGGVVFLVACWGHLGRTWAQKGWRVAGMNLGRRFFQGREGFWENRQRVIGKVV